MPPHVADRGQALRWLGRVAITAAGSAGRHGTVNSRIMESLVFPPTRVLKKRPAHSTDQQFRHRPCRRKNFESLIELLFFLNGQARDRRLSHSPNSDGREISRFSRSNLSR